MSSLQPEARAFAYPKLLRILKTTNAQRDAEGDACWNAEFFPYGEPDDIPVFCLSNKSDMLVCRIIPAAGPPEVEILRSFETYNPDGDDWDDTQEGDEYCSTTWAYIEPDEPLLLGAGDRGLIRVFDVVKGTLKASLKGHGQGIINDLATHPIYPWIVASASVDKSVRIWDLRRWDSKHESATIVICGAGHGHKESVLTVSWHDSGRYLVSGGFDNRICVWNIPDFSPESDFWHEISAKGAERHSDRVRTIIFPHFVTIALHENWIDCVRFWGDDIFSKASAEHKIVLWRITGFNSNLPQPDPILAPKAEEHLDTRNGFIREMTTSDAGITQITTVPAYRSFPAYERLLQFHIPSVELFFMRFEILKRSPAHTGIHDVLAVGNTKSTVHFWDLEAIDLGTDYNNGSSGRRGGRPRRGAAAAAGSSSSRKGAIAGTTSTTHGGKSASLRRINQLSSLERSDSAPSSLPSMSLDNSAAGDSARSTPSLSLDPRNSSPPVRSNSTDATSLTSDNLHLAANANANANANSANSANATSFFSSSSNNNPAASANTTVPAENRERFPLHIPHQTLTRAHHAINFKDQFSAGRFTARGIGWSPDGRYCVVAGETVDNVVAAPGGAGGGGGGGNGKGGKGVKVVAKAKIGAAVLFGRDGV